MPNEKDNKMEEKNGSKDTKTKEEPGRIIKFLSGLSGWYCLSFMAMILFFLVICCSLIVFVRSTNNLTNHPANPIYTIHHSTQQPTTVLLDHTFNINDSVYIVPAKQMEKYDSIIITNQQQIIKRQEELVNDIRQETNNNIDKISAWLAFWIAVVALLGVFVPFTFQLSVYRREQKIIKEHLTELANLKKQYETEHNTHCIKILARTFDCAIENNLIPKNIEKPAFTSDFAREISELLKETFNKLDSDLISKPRIRLQFISALLMINMMLLRISLNANHRLRRRIQTAQDTIEQTLELLNNNKYDLRNNLSKIQEKIDKIAIIIRDEMS